MLMREQGSTATGQLVARDSITGFSARDLFAGRKSIRMEKTSTSGRWGMSASGVTGRKTTATPSPCRATCIRVWMATGRGLFLFAPVGGGAGRAAFGFRREFPGALAAAVESGLRHSASGVLRPDHALQPSTGRDSRHLRHRLFASPDAEVGTGFFMGAGGEVESG